jgi:hypothetical protein
VRRVLPFEAVPVKGIGRHYRKVTHPIPLDQKAFWPDGTEKGYVLDLMVKDQGDRSIKVGLIDDTSAQVFLRETHFRGVRKKVDEGEGEDE